MEKQKAQERKKQGWDGEKDNENSLSTLSNKGWIEPQKEHWWLPV
jgi:hypothetical protein